MTDGEATRGLKMGIVLLIKKKYGNNMQLLAVKQTKKDKEKEMGETDRKKR